MVARNALVLVDGTPAELPSGDTLNGASGGSDVADPTVAQSFSDDFMTGSVETGEIGQLGWSFTNGSITKPTGIQNHPGIIRHTGSTTANQVCSFHTGNSANEQICRFDEWSEATFVFAEAAASQTDMTLQLGIFSALGNLAPSHGVYLEIRPADSNYFFVSRNGGTETRTDSGIARTTNWIKVKMRKSGANVIFNINGGSDVTLSSNVPDAADTICVGKQSAQTGTTARNIDLDWISFKLVAITR